MIDQQIGTMTEEEAASYLRLKPRTLKEERLRGRIDCHKIVGGRIRYTLDQLNAYLSGHPMNEKRVARA